MTSGGFGFSGKLFWGALGNDLAATLPAFWPHVDNPVGGFDDVEVVFDNNHRIAASDKLVQDGKETFDVVCMETSGGLVEDVESFAGGAAGKFGSELDTLGFAARKGGGGLPKADVTKTNFLNSFEFVVNGREIMEEIAGFVDGHI